MVERRNLEKSESGIIEGAVGRVFGEYKTGKRFDHSEADREIQFRQSDAEGFRNRVIKAVMKRVLAEVFEIRSNIGIAGTIPPDVADLDLSHVWHPYTQMAEYGDEQLIICKAKGATVTDINDKSYIDAVGGLWCVNVGMAEPIFLPPWPIRPQTLHIFHYLAEAIYQVFSFQRSLLQSPQMG